MQACGGRCRSGPTACIIGCFYMGGRAISMRGWGPSTHLRVPFPIHYVRTLRRGFVLSYGDTELHRLSASGRLLALAFCWETVSCRRREFWSSGWSRHGLFFWRYDRLIWRDRRRNASAWRHRFFGLRWQGFWSLGLGHSCGETRIGCHVERDLSTLRGCENLRAGGCR